MLWYQKVFFWQISNIIIKFVYRDFLYLNPSRVYVVLNWYWAHFGKSYQENQVVVWRSCFWPLISHQETIIYKPRTSLGLSMHIKSHVQNNFWNFLRQTSRFTRMKLTTVVALRCFSSKQWRICLFFVLHLWNIKLTESKNVFCINGRVACTIKLNIKETFMQEDGFLQKFMSWMDCSQITKHLLLDKYII